MHPAITHELTRAVLADRERELRAIALAALARDGPGSAMPGRSIDRPASRTRRTLAFLARVRTPPEPRLASPTTGAADDA